MKSRGAYPALAGRLGQILLDVEKVARRNTILLFSLEVKMDKEKLLHKLRVYKQNNADRYGIEKLGIFGSYTRWQANATSDVDIVIKIKIPDPYIAPVTLPLATYLHTVLL